MFIGTLLPLHKTTRDISAEECGPIQEQYGIHRTEVALREIDRINNSSLLRGVKLGIEIRDSCYTESIAMQESVEFIRVTLGHGEQDKCCARHGDCQNVNNLTNLAAVVGPGTSGSTIATHNLLQVEQE